MSATLIYIDHGTISNNYFKWCFIFSPVSTLPDVPAIWYLTVGVMVGGGDGGDYIIGDDFGKYSDKDSAV